MDPISGTIFGKILGMVLGPVVDKLLSTGLSAYQAHIQGQISKEELRAKITGMVQDAFVEVSKSSNDAVTKTFESFMQTLRVSKIAQWVWAYFTVSQITFLVWLELGVPYLSYQYGIHYPGVGSLDQWAYAGVLSCLGLGPLALKFSQPKVPSLKELS